MMAGLRSLVLEIVAIDKPKNIAATLDFFQDHFFELLTWLKHVNFL